MLKTSDLYLRVYSYDISQPLSEGERERTRRVRVWKTTLHSILLEAESVWMRNDILLLRRILSM